MVGYMERDMSGSKLGPYRKIYTRRMSVLEAPIATKRKPAARSQHPKFPKMGTR